MASHCHDRRISRKVRRPGLWIGLAVGASVALLGGIICALIYLTPKNDGFSPQQSLRLELPQSVSVEELVRPVSWNLKAEEFVSGLEGTGISVELAENPAAQPGSQTVTLRFSQGELSCLRRTACYRFAMEQSVMVDVADGAVADVKDFVADGAVEISFDGEVPALDSIGEKPVTLLCGGAAYKVCYIVKESNPPQGVAKEITGQIGTVPAPETLVEQISDESSVTVTYKEIPVLTTIQDYPVTLVLTDAYGNVTELTSVIHAIPGENAPHFTGLEPLCITIGDTISYKNGVSAEDLQDGTVAFTVDASQINQNQTGSYIAYYSATDADGNKTIAPREIVVQEVNQAAAEKIARQVLGRIIKDDMTLDEQIYAVQQFTRYSVQFVGSSNKDSIWHAAYEGFTTGKGDCYTYYAINRILLDMLGIENLEVARVGGTSHHWWNLVRFADGMYYHVDSCPRAIVVSGVDAAKMTESDLKTYTNDSRVTARRPNYYVYDSTLPEYVGIEIAP